MVATSSDKGLLKAASLDQFKQYLTNIGMDHRAGKGEYQVMQVKCGASWLAVCRDARGHITTPIELRLAVNNFNSGAMPLPKAPLKPPIRTREQFLDDLRDDFAMAALQGDLAAMPPDAPFRPEVLATRAYHVADAMLAARVRK